MARLFAGSENKEVRLQLELAVNFLIRRHGGQVSGALVDKIMRDVADRVNMKDILAVSTGMLVLAEGMVKSALGLSDPANVNKLAAKNDAEADAKTPVSLVDELRKRDMRASTNTSNGLLNGHRSSAQFTTLKDESNPTYLAAKDAAKSLGMDWAPPELLRLGQEAIRTMHAMGFDRHVYDDMTKRGKFEAAQVVAVAGLAKKRNMTPEQAKELARSATDISESMGKTDSELQRRFRKELTDFSNSNDDPEAWRRVDQVMREAEKRNPSMKAQTDQFREQLGKAQAVLDKQSTLESGQNIVESAVTTRTAELSAQAAAKASVFGEVPAAPATGTTNPSTPSEGAKPAQQASAEPKKLTAPAPVRAAQATPAP